MATIERSHDRTMSGGAAMPGGDILIVDDTVADLRLLSDILEESGYYVRAATGGELALRSIRARQPALVLLDVRMPGMDGFEMCRRVKSDVTTRDIPVIFLTALAETADKAKGFEIGAVDYITKPFQAQEVLARVRTHLALSAAREELQISNRELQASNEKLSREIAERKQAQEALGTALKRLQVVSERLTKAHEEERRRIAFALHEQSGQELTTLMLHLQVLEQHCHSKEAKARLQDARAIAELALARVRSMTLDLRPSQLDDFGLYATLGAHCRQQAHAAGWSAHIDIPDSGKRPSPDVEVACFRVVQQALTNAARHASATEVWLSVRERKGDLVLSVRDNGIGFDAAAIRDFSERPTLGLIGMEERVRQVGGQFEVSSTPGNGTEVRAVFPGYDAPR